MLLCPVRKSEKGFSLIEMIAVTIILGIVAAVVAPNLLGLLNRNRLNQSIADVEGALKEAQKQATRNGRSCQLTINASANDNTSNNDNAVTAPCLLTTRSLPANNLMKINTNRANITFSGKGNIQIDDSAGSALPRPLIVVYVPNGGANLRRCVVIESSFGSIRTGEYSENPPAGLLAWDDDGKCQ